MPRGSISLPAGVPRVGVPIKTSLILGGWRGELCAMPDQLPRGAEGAAAVTLSFASISWICSAVMIWLTWTHNQRSSYVALIAYITMISTIASIIQQIHDIVLWRDVMTEQYQHRVAEPDNADLQIANGSVGMDLVLFYIQFYCYNVEALLITFWASELVQSIYCLNERPATARILERFNATGKIVALVLPIIFILIVRAPTIHGSVRTLVHIVGIPLIISLGCGSLLVLTILFRYIQTRRKLAPFFPSSLQSSHPGSSKSRNRISWGGAVLGSHGVYDRWLITRFTLSFVLLGFSLTDFAVLICPHGTHCTPLHLETNLTFPIFRVFQATSFLFQRFSAHNMEVDVQSTSPDLSVTRARQTLYLFIPGNTPGVALFIVFGTTTAFRRHMYKTFVPLRWQKQEQHQGMVVTVPPVSTMDMRIYTGDRIGRPTSVHSMRLAAFPSTTPETDAVVSEASQATSPNINPQKEIRVIRSHRRTRSFPGDTRDTIETRVRPANSHMSAPARAREGPIYLERRGDWAGIPPTTPEALIIAPESGYRDAYAHGYSDNSNNGGGYALGPGTYHQNERGRDRASMLIYDPSTGRWKTGNSGT
ncbi:hypothetical protein F5X96DRAFT_131158 [Biscogniauxia mediterranea]|nr:hypothetical protein F5X96DRAFT_131158 [Biscogniauxia mediterranea]